MARYSYTVSAVAYNPLFSTNLLSNNYDLLLVPQGMGGYGANLYAYAEVDHIMVAYNEDTQGDIVAYLGPNSTPPTHWGQVQIGDTFTVAINDAQDFVAGPAWFKAHMPGLSDNCAFYVVILNINGNQVTFRVEDPSNAPAGCMPDEFRTGCSLNIVPYIPINYNSQNNRIGFAQNILCIKNNPVLEIKRTDLPPSFTCELTGVDYDQPSPGGTVVARSVSPSAVPPAVVATNTFWGNLTYRYYRYTLILDNLYTHLTPDFTTCQTFGALWTRTLRCTLWFSKDLPDERLGFNILASYPNITASNNCFPHRPVLTQTGLSQFRLDYNGSPISSTARAFIFVFFDDTVYTSPPAPFSFFLTTVLTLEMTPVFNTGTSAQFTVNYPGVYALLQYGAKVCAFIISGDTVQDQVAIYADPIELQPTAVFDYTDLVQTGEVCNRPLDSIYLRCIAFYRNDIFFRNSLFDRNNPIPENGTVRVTVLARAVGFSNFTTVEQITIPVDAFYLCENSINRTTPPASWDRDTGTGLDEARRWPIVRSRSTYPLTGGFAGDLWFRPPLSPNPDDPQPTTLNAWGVLTNGHAIAVNCQASFFLPPHAVSLMPYVPNAGPPLDVFVLAISIPIRDYILPLNFYNIPGVITSIPRLFDPVVMNSNNFELKFVIDYITSQGIIRGETDILPYSRFSTYQSYNAIGTDIILLASSNTTDVYEVINPNVGNDTEFVIGLFSPDVGTARPLYYLYRGIANWFFSGYSYDFRAIPGFMRPFDHVRGAAVQRLIDGPLTYDMTTRRLTVDKTALPPGDYCLYFRFAGSNSAPSFWCGVATLHCFSILPNATFPDIQLSNECCEYFYYVRGEVIDVLTFDIQNAPDNVFTISPENGYAVAMGVSVETLANECFSLRDFCPVIVVDSIDELMDAGLIEIEALFDNRVFAAGFQYVQLRELVRHKGFVRPAEIQYEQIEYETITARERRLIQKTFEFVAEIEILCKSGCQVGNVYKLLHAQYWRVRNLRSNENTVWEGIIEDVSIDASEYPHAIKFTVKLKQRPRYNEARYYYQ